jgi:hypothetical protein
MPFSYGGRMEQRNLFREEDTMKKMVFAGLVAISLIALCQQNASAWVNSKFSIGLNMQRQSGGNNFLWGAYHNGQPPGPEAFGGSGGGGGYPGSMPSAVPQFAPAMPYHHSNAPQYQPMPQTMPAITNTYPAQQNSYTGTYYYSSPFQFASYPRESTFYYYAPESYSYYGW